MYVGAPYHRTAPWPSGFPLTAADSSTFPTGWTMRSPRPWVTRVGCLAAPSWRAELTPGERVLILGATGVVGRLAVQAARLLGAGRIVAAGRDPDALAEAPGLGADATVRVDSDGDLAAAFHDAAGGPIDVVLDYVGGRPLVAALGAAATGVRIVQVGDAADPQLTMPAPLLRAKGVVLLGFVPRLAGPEALAASYAELAEHVLAGRLRVEVERFPLTEVAAVWHRRSRRRVVLVPPGAALD